jgi:hypothetical protein
MPSYHTHLSLCLPYKGIVRDQVVQRGVAHPKFRRCAGHVASVRGESASRIVIGLVLPQFGRRFSFFGPEPIRERDAF